MNKNVIILEKKKNVKGTWKLSENNAFIGKG